MSLADEPRTSISHPLSISWVLPPEAFCSAGPSTEGSDVLELISSLPPRASTPYAALAGPTPVPPIDLLRPRNPLPPPNPPHNPVARGNLALSSCPGKQVRLSGPVNGRASVKRSLHLDFFRLASLGFKAVVCCIDDTELAFLGAPFEQYSETAEACGIEVLRLPMAEGGHPETLAELEPLFARITEITESGGNVLVHCRGGLGRAGVVVCCYLIHSGLIKSKSMVESPQKRRSPWARTSLRYNPERAMAGLDANSVFADAAQFGLPGVEGNTPGEADGDACGRSRIAGEELAVSSSKPRTRMVPEEFIPARELAAVVSEGGGYVDEERACTRAIRYVRLRRSPKAIETVKQEEYIARYARWRGC